ncbi:MAG TPA: hypothetical protein ENJ95_19155 [Bacteroidetes bacterium]|nr:hypothetical protein [Bacteroidota bacterium]
MQQKLENRKEVWKAISLFYLDTELQEPDYKYITEIFKKSNLTLAELKEIDLLEVFPALQLNLTNVAGEWAGFDEEWLIKVCTENYNKRGNKLFKTITKLRNVFSYWMRKKHWEIIEGLCNAK